MFLAQPELWYSVVCCSVLTAGLGWVVGGGEGSV